MPLSAKGIRFKQTTYPAVYLGIHEMNFLGASLVSIKSGATAFASSSYGAGYPPSQMLDGQTSTSWANRYADTSDFFGVYWASIVDISVIQVWLSPAGSEYWPNGAALEVSFDTTNGTDGTWYEVASGITMVGQAGSVEMWEMNLDQYFSDASYKPIPLASMIHALPASLARGIL